MISGAGGLLGRSLVEHFSLSGWRVVALARRALDITDEQRVREAVGRERPDVIINCAATTDVDRCESEPEAARKVNVEGPRFIARIAEQTGAQIVHVSTDYVFDGRKEGLYTQEDEPNPLSEYGRTKLAGELAVRQETDRFYIVRSSWIFGSGGKNFGSRVIELAERGVPIKGVTDQISIPTYAPDLAARIRQLIELGVHGLYHLTNSGPGTWYEFARLALDLAGLKEVKIEPVTRADLEQPAERPRNSAMRCTRSERLGLTPLRHWHEAVTEWVYEEIDFLHKEI
jgi:dTDP-4-dehydrorhamnose reductase